MMFFSLLSLNLSPLILDDGLYAHANNGIDGQRLFQMNAYSSACSFRQLETSDYVIGEQEWQDGRTVISIFHPLNFRRGGWNVSSCRQFLWQV